MNHPLPPGHIRLVGHQSLGASHILTQTEPAPCLALQSNVRKRLVAFFSAVVSNCARGRLGHAEQLVGEGVQVQVTGLGGRRGLWRVIYRSLVQEMHIGDPFPKQPHPLASEKSLSTYWVKCPPP